MGSALAVLVLVVALALAFDYINGFHDTANAVATVVSTNVLPGRTAVLLAAAANFLGAFAGLGVAKTIGGDIADPASVTQLVVAAALLGAIFWNLLTWYYGIPSSSSHALIGGLVGAVWCHRVVHGAEAGGAIWGLITSKGVLLTLKALVLSPLVGLVGGFLLMGLLLWLVRPINGFAAETAAALRILVATWVRAPVSTTHVISSSVMGVGASKRVSAVRWGVAGNMLTAWVLTIPVSAGVSAAVYALLYLAL